MPYKAPDIIAVNIGQIILGKTFVIRSEFGPAIRLIIVEKMELIVLIINLVGHSRYIDILIEEPPAERRYFENRWIRIPNKKPMPKTI